jgi:hypothetical protein
MMCFSGALRRGRRPNDTRSLLLARHQARAWFLAELTNRGELGNVAVVRAFFGIVKIVTPILVLVVLLNGLGIVS